MPERTRTQPSWAGRRLRSPLFMAGIVIVAVGCFISAASPLLSLLLLAVGSVPVSLFVVRDRQTRLNRPVEPADPAARPGGSHRA